MVADVPGLESDTKLIRRGRRGECRGESREACLFDHRLYGGSELALLLMSPADELDARATEGSSAWVAFFFNTYNNVTPVPL
jgi:hypothetical protein